MDFLRVYSVFFASVTISLSDTNDILKGLSFVATIVYTIVKTIDLIKKPKPDGKDNGNT